MIRAAARSVSTGIVALAVVFVVKTAATYGVGLADAGLRAEAPRISVFGTIHPSLFALPTYLGSQSPDADTRVASLGTEDATDAALDDEDEQFESAGPRASFDERFFFGRRVASFDDRFGATGLRRIALANPVETSIYPALSLPPPLPNLRTQAAAAPAFREPAQKTFRLASLPGANISEKQLRATDAPKDPLGDIDGRTAIYDITAHTVYMPGGRRLEAHSGLGEHMDDPRHIQLRMRGPTPPNVYRLVMRERLFHGVRAIRLIPIDEAKMYGRAGILAHSYMLGANGQSNGCVSFNDYPAFLNAFLDGKVDRLVVVERLDNVPTASNANGEWLPKFIKGLFGQS